MSIDPGQPTLFDQLVDEPTVGPSHAKDPWTSRAAAQDNSRRIVGQRMKVLGALVDAGDYGCTDYELGLSLGLLRTAAGTRRGELRDLLMCVGTDRTRLTDTGNKGQVHVVTEYGVDEYAAAKARLEAVAAESKYAGPCPSCGLRRCRLHAV